jgi:hypothetical protein
LEPYAGGSPGFILQVTFAGGKLTKIHILEAS